MDSTELHLAEALARLGAADQAGALPHLNTILDRDAEDLRALYLLAWAQWRDGDRTASRETFAQADALGPPTAADTWFFRGLAIHFDEPQVAIESYRRANALRSQRQEFYPLAILHLARARNQELYAERKLEAFTEAEESLRQLAENGYYGIYPYYLLSISHCLAAEIYSGSRGTRDDSLVQEHYAEALNWARAGQPVDPTSERGLTAEAACLESMGRFAEAIEVRTRAIEAATKPMARCEGYHYRWRLYYWSGELDAALADVEAHAGCDPESPCYAHTFPALIYAELGDMSAALNHARAIAADAPADAAAVLSSATCLRLLGRADEARTLLAARAESVDFAVGLVPPQSEAWLRALYDYGLGNATLQELEALAADAASPWKLRGEAYFHAATIRLADGERDGAYEMLERAYRSFDGERRYTYKAKLICEKMREDSAWPAWIRVSWGEMPGFHLGHDGEPLAASALSRGERQP